MSDPAADHLPPSRARRLIAALAGGQLVSWGVLTYAFPVLALPMEAELGWSKAEVNGALSVGLLISGLLAYPVGAWIDRFGGRAVMSLGSALAAVLLAGWAFVGSLPAFYALWVGLGAATAATLYEPAFAVLTRLFPASFRTRITTLSLVGGFASTMFVPLTQILVERIGWRDTILVLAAAITLVPLPIHLFCLGGERLPAAAAAPPPPGLVRKAMRTRAFWGLALCFTAYYAAFNAVTFHLVPLLAERAVPTPVMLGAIAVIGPAQVIGRLVLLRVGARLGSRAVGTFVTLAFPAAVLLLTLDSLAALYAFAALFGLANGMMTILRGTAVPDLLWREGYGAINGALSLPAMAAKAVAPVAAALVWEVGGYDAVLGAVLAAGLLAAAGFVFAIRSY